MARHTYDEALCRSAFEHIARRIVRPVISRHYDSGSPSAREKHDRSVVTEADVEIEREIRAFLSEAFPTFGVIGEELGAVDTHREYVWTVDPIDGTEAFVAGVPLFGTLLALIHQTEGTRTPVLGAIYLPVQDRLIVGDANETTIDGCLIRMNASVPTDHARLILGDVSQLARTTPAHRHASLLQMAARFRSAHSWGDCLGYLNMLEGRAHARVEANLGIDDIAPLEPIFLGAGGVATTWDGLTFSKALSRLQDIGDPSHCFESVCAVTSELHQELIGLLG